MSSGPKKIVNTILVEDDAECREELTTILEDKGHQVASFESANHAVRFMQSQPWSWFPKLIVTDIVLDGIGGYQFMRMIGELYPNKAIPMVVVSKLYSPDYVYEAEVAGATAFLPKPLHKDKFLAAILKATSQKI